MVALLKDLIDPEFSRFVAVMLVSFVLCRFPEAELVRELVAVMIRFCAAKINPELMKMLLFAVRLFFA